MDIDHYKLTISKGSVRGSTATKFKHNDAFMLCLSNSSSLSMLRLSNSCMGGSVAPLDHYYGQISSWSHLPLWWMQLRSEREAFLHEADVSCFGFDGSTFIISIIFFLKVLNQKYIISSIQKILESFSGLLNNDFTALCSHSASRNGSCGVTAWY